MPAPDKSRKELYLKLHFVFYFEYDTFFKFLTNENFAICLCYH